DYQTYKEGDEERLVGEAEGIDSLRQIYEKLREQYIVEAARGVLKRNIRENELTFYLNKQAAYVGKLHFCAPERESPMGAIKVTIISNKINELVEWLCPPTRDSTTLRCVSHLSNMKRAARYIVFCRVFV
ncbi:MAG: RNA-binding domain-containing protein, partial [Candidatus Jordarchaeales archaeon]